MRLWAILGLLVGLYALYAALSGEVFARSGIWGKTVSRDESPTEFWMTVAIYAGLALAMATLF